MNRSLPLQRSKALLESQGYAVWIVEKWVQYPFPGHRVDLFNLIDLLAIKSDIKGVFGVQCCADSGISSHLHKALENAYLPTWQACGNRFAIWGWGKKGAKGKRKLWTLREVKL